MITLKNILGISYFREVINYELINDLLHIALKNNETILKFQQQYSLQYIGEIAERFHERDFVKTDKDLISLILGLSFVNSNGFMYGQEKIFFNNVLNLLKEKEYSNEFTIKFCLLHYAIKRDFLSTNSQDLCIQLLTELEQLTNDLEVKPYWFELVMLLDMERFTSNNFSVKSLLTKILNKCVLNINDFNMRTLIDLLQYLYMEKEKNILDTFALKVNEVKNNKEIVKKLRLLRKICFSEITKEHIPTIKTELNLDEPKIYTINHQCSEHFVSGAATERIAKELISCSISSKNNIDPYIKAEVFDLIKSNSYGRNTLKFNIMNVSNEIMFNDLMNSFSTIFTTHEQYQILQNKFLYNLLSEQTIKEWVTGLLNSYRPLECFLFCYDLAKKLNINLDYNLEENSTYLNNLFSKKIFDIFDFDFIRKEKLERKVLSFLKNDRDELRYLLYANKLKNVGKYVRISFSSHKKILQLIEEKIIVENEVYINSLTEDFNINYNNIEELKNTLCCELLNYYFDYISQYDTKLYVSDLYEAVINEYVCTLLQISEDEIYAIKKEIYDKKLLDDKILITLKPLFVSKEDLEKEELNKVMTTLKEKNFVVDLVYSYSNEGQVSLEKFFKLHKVIIEKFQIAIEALIEKFEDILKDKGNYDVNHLLRFYFLVFNSNISDKYKEHILNLTNAAYLLAN